MLGQELILFLNFLWMFSFGYFTWAWLYYPSINGIFFQIIHILYTEPLKKMISVSLILVCVSYKHAKCKYSPSLHDILWFKLKMVVFMISCSSNWKWMCVSMKNLLCIQHWQSKALVKKRLWWKYIFKNLLHSQQLNGPNYGLCCCCVTISSGCKFRLNLKSENGRR